MLVLLALLLGVASSSSDLVWQQEHTFASMMGIDTLHAFEEWAIFYDRDYKTTEEAALRYMVWLNGLYTVAETNSQELSYKLRMNQFGDMTGDEFRDYVHGDHGRCFRSDQLANIHGRDVWAPVSHGAAPAPAAVDWTTKGVVTPVKDQGQCG
jgi:hypothetical protein